MDKITWHKSSELPSEGAIGLDSVLALMYNENDFEDIFIVEAFYQRASEKWCYWSTDANDWVFTENIKQWADVGLSEKFKQIKEGLVGDSCLY